MTMPREMNTAGPVVDSINHAIRENPLAAGLIGAGLAWMLFGGAKGFGFIGGAIKDASVATAAAAGTTASSIGAGLSRAGSGTVAGIQTAASRAAEAVGSVLPEPSFSAADDPSPSTDNVDSAPFGTKDLLASAAASGREYGSVIKSGLSESLERQPLLLGAIGLVIGAGLASTFASTSTETALVGESTAAVLKKAREFGGEISDRAQQVVADVKHEAASQGFTADDAKLAAKDVAGRAKAVFAEAKDAVGKPPVNRS